MPAKHKKEVYKPLEVSNPFHEGQDKAYSDILLDKMKETRTWRMTTYLHFFLFVVSLILFFVSMNQQKTVPVLVNVMPSGESQYLGEVKQSGPIQVSEASINFQIRKFVSNLRSVPTDYQIISENIDECSIMVTSSFYPVMRKSLLEDSPFDHFGKMRRSLSFESVLHITGSSYQVNWTETEIDPSSYQKTTKLRAVVTVRLITPSESTIKRNPLGIYIENFEMTEL